MYLWLATCNVEQARPLVSLYTAFMLPDFLLHRNSDWSVQSTRPHHSQPWRSLRSCAELNCLHSFGHAWWACVCRCARCNVCGYQAFLRMGADRDSYESFDTRFVTRSVRTKAFSFGRASSHAVTPLPTYPMSLDRVIKSAGFSKVKRLLLHAMYFAHSITSLKPFGVVDCPRLLFLQPKCSWGGACSAGTSLSPPPRMKSAWKSFAWLLQGLHQSMHQWHLRHPQQNRQALLSLRKRYRCLLSFRKRCRGLLSLSKRCRCLLSRRKRYSVWQSVEALSFTVLAGFIKLPVVKVFSVHTSLLILHW